MSDQKPSATGQSFASSAVSGAPKPGNDTPAGVPGLSAAPYQGGYLSKLFGLGAGTAAFATHAPSSAIDEAHEYHPGVAYHVYVGACPF